MAVGTPRAFDKKFKFIVDVDGLQSAAFQKCSELAAEVAKIEYYEGGALIANKSPGRITIPDITLERGATRDNDLFTWFSAVVSLTSQLGSIEPLFKRNFDIVQMDRDGSELVRFSIHGAWPIRFSAGDWDNEADENRIESVTLSIDGWQKTFGI